MRRYIHTDNGLLTDDGILIKEQEYSEQANALVRILPKHAHLKESLYWRKSHNNIVLFESTTWQQLTLSDDMFRFMTVYDKGAMKAMGGSNAAKATIDGIKVSGYRDTRNADTEYELCTNMVCLYLRGSVIRTLDKIRRQ